MLELVLASRSPRRIELLQKAGFEFRHSPVKVSETIDENLNAGENASQIATAKAQACLMQDNSLKSGDFLILGADTVVTLGGQILGKPVDAEEAARFLRLLSGRAHSVITGLALLESGTGKLWKGYDSTEVRFRELSESEIESYVASGEPMDKAGAYAIQGGAAKFVTSHTGSWSNVVGLPLEKLESALKENDWVVRRRTP